jgi:hypothetical protein
LPGDKVNVPTTATAGDAITKIAKTRLAFAVFVFIIVININEVFDK